MVAGGKQAVLVGAVTLGLLTCAAGPADPVVQANAAAPRPAGTSRPHGGARGVVRPKVARPHPAAGRTGRDARVSPGSVDRLDLGPGDAPAGAGVVDRSSISADGRYVAFASLADNLVPGSSGHRGVKSDVYLRDRLTRRTVLVSATPAGVHGDDSSSAPALSADGRWVAFESYADDLAPGARHGVGNVYLRDLVAGRTILLSGAVGADSDSAEPSIDTHGEHVAFESLAHDSGDEAAPGSAVLVWDRATGGVRRVGLDGGVGNTPVDTTRPALSADGRQVAFIASGTRGGGCEDAYVEDLSTGALTLASVATDSAGGCGRISDVALSGDGRHIGFSTTWPLSPADQDFTYDVYVRDLVARTTTMVSAPRTVSGAVERGASYGPSLSQDGRWVAFTSFAEDLGTSFVLGTDSAYLADLHAGTVQLIAQAPGHRVPSGSTYRPVITADAAHVVFASSAGNLVPGTNNQQIDAFVLDRAGVAYPAAPRTLPAPVLPPRIRIESGPLGTVAAADLQHFLLGSDIAPVRFQCRFDAGQWVWCARQVRWKVRPGGHRFQARAVDAYGNVDPVPVSRVFRAR